MVESAEAKKGVKTKIFGVVLIFLGSLNCLLMWRGGLQLSTFPPILLVSGIALFAVGTIRGGH